MERIDSAAAHVREIAREAAAPRVGIVLGSGLGAVAEAMEVEATIPYAEIPGFHASTVQGHAGRLCLGRLGGVPAAIMQGRIHLYEGHDPLEVVLPVRVLVRLGAKELIVTNAAGGINPRFATGDLMLISDHLNLTGKNCLIGPDEPGLGPRFADMTDAYAGALRTLARQAGDELGLALQEGVYAGLLGPSYETPAEIRMLGILGADAVGMSTVLETIAACHMGARVLGISCISNLAAGLSAGPLSHDEVKAAADAVQGKLTDLITAAVRRIAACDG